MQGTQLSHLGLITAAADLERPLDLAVVSLRKFFFVKPQIIPQLACFGRIMVLQGFDDLIRSPAWGESPFP